MLQNFGKQAYRFLVERRCDCNFEAEVSDRDHDVFPAGSC
jgi:hypothetical protein